MIMPEHLRHLRTNHAGLPVPYINTWGDEKDASRWMIRHDRTIKERAAYFIDDEDGEPDFLHQSPQRQRACMVYGRCQVCTRPVDWEHRRLVISAAVSLAKIEIAGTQAIVVTEPWLCPDCAEFCLRVCPGLLRARKASDCRLIGGITEAGTLPVLSRGWIEGPYEQASKDYPVAIFVKLMLRDITIEEAAA